MILAKEFEGELWATAADCQAELDRLQREVEELRQRLEIDPRTKYDGIACRDATIKQLQRENEELRAALLKEQQLANKAYAALKAQSTEPFGYWHQGETDEESDFFLASESGDVRCDYCVVLYATPPTATALVEDFRKRVIEECMDRVFYKGQGYWQVRDAIESLPLEKP